MGRVGKLLSFSRVERNGAKTSDVKIDPGGGPNITPEHFAPPGDDSFPLSSDYVVTTEIEGTGNEAVVGYVDPLNDPVALKGDKRIYGRNSASGATVNQAWLKSDGSILISNANGSLELQANGDFLINGVTITAAGKVIIPTSLDLNGKEIAEHDHDAGTPPGNTGVNN